MSDTPETDLQILQNGQGRMRGEIEAILEKRSLEVVFAVRRVASELAAVKRERDEARAEAEKWREEWIQECRATGMPRPRLPWELPLTNPRTTE